MAVALPPGPPPFPLARFTVEQYHRMIASGAFTEDDHLELIDGWLVQKMAKGPAHEYSLGQAEALLRERVPAGWHVRNQAPITLSRSEPEPDIAIVRGDYRTRHPSGSDLALVVEISDTTVATDRLKARMYGLAKIPEYWIVNLGGRCVERFASPIDSDENGYAINGVVSESDSLTVTIAGGVCVPIPVRQLLP